MIVNSHESIDRSIVFSMQSCIYEEQEKLAFIDTYLFEGKNFQKNVAYEKMLRQKLTMTCFGDTRDAYDARTKEKKQKTRPRDEEGVWNHL